MGKNKIKIRILVILFFVIVVFIIKIIFFLLSNKYSEQQAVKSIWCSESAPEWMVGSLKWLILDNGIFTNQIAYYDQAQKMHLCISGWEKSGLLGKSISVDTVFRYASLTKIITHHAVLKLIKEKKLTLNQPVVSLFSELKGVKFADPRINNITVLNLLEHRSGFNPKLSNDPFFQFNVMPWCPYKLESLRNIFLDFNPNQEYAYDNRNTCLLGLIVERLSGDNIRDYLVDNYNLFDYNVVFTDGFPLVNEVEYNYKNQLFWNKINQKELDYKALSAMGGLVGSAENLVNLVNNEILKSNINVFEISEIAKKSCKFNDFKKCNGVVFRSFKKDNKSLQFYFRNGSLAASSSILMVTPKNEIVVWLGNSVRLDAENNEFDRILYNAFK